MDKKKRKENKKEKASGSRKHCGKEKERRGRGAVVSFDGAKAREGERSR